jgi:hypothetical protein
MWFDIGKGYHEKDAKVLDLEIRFLTARYENGSILHHEEDSARLGDPEPRENDDYHIFTSAPIMLEDEEVYLIEIDLDLYMVKAFKLLESLNESLDSAILKHFSLFIEANNTHGALTIEWVECYFSNEIFSTYVLIPSLLYGLLTFVSTLLLSLYIEKILKKRRNKIERTLKPLSQRV